MKKEITKGKQKYLIKTKIAVNKLKIKIKPIV
jgi:hypothetical protein